MYFHRTPVLLPLLYPSLVWHKDREQKSIFLTFDDGPVPEVTAFALRSLATYKALATFFCVGENIARYPDIFKKIISGGHSIGNHTHNHLNGWKTQDDTYLANVNQCFQAIKEHTAQPTPKFFRPPYGRITRKQINEVRGQYNIIMWDVLSGDFDQNLAKEKCLANTIKHTRKGSIVIFHDSYKAYRNLQYVLPRYLDHFATKGYLFKAL